MNFPLQVYLHPSRTFKLFLAFVYIFLISGAVVPPLIAQEGTQAIDLQEGLPQLQLALAIILVLIALEFIRAFWRRPVGKILRAAWLPAIFVILALLSSLWSVDSGLTLRRGVAVTGMLLAAVFLLASFGYRRSIMLITGLLAAIAILSLITSLFLPALGVHQAGSHLGRWKGVYLHKNLLGREMALAVGLFVLAAIHAKSAKARGIWVMLTGLAFALVLQAHSATGLVAAAVALVVALNLYWARSQPKAGPVIVVAAILVSVVAGFILALAPEWLFDLLGRDLTFTGRSTLWSNVLRNFAEKPYFGYGYRAFWGSPGGVAMSEGLGWRVTHAHNALLDVALSLGVLGLLSVLYLLLAPLVRWLTTSPRCRSESSHYYETGVVLLAVVLVISASDSILLGPNNLFLLLLFLQFAGVRRSWRAARKSLRFSRFAPTSTAGTRS